MDDPRVGDALKLWGLENCPVKLVAARENRVYRVHAPFGMLALRLHRLGYRSRAELDSELIWMAALEERGMRVPRPVPALDGNLCMLVQDTLVDILTFLDGAPLATESELADGADSAGIIVKLGSALARLHNISDEWDTPIWFSRPSWDVEGLLGDQPVWDRFWENPALTPDQTKLLTKVRDVARREIVRLAPDLDYGLIHADAVPENVLVYNKDVTLIDFDDGGYGFRLFDLATAYNRLQQHAPGGGAGHRLLEGYFQIRQIDLDPLPLFCLLRSLTYVGWVISRINEPGAADRSIRFINEATRQAEAYLEQTKN